VIRHSLFEISLYLFGDEAVQGARRKILILGLGWVLILWALPFFDRFFDLPTIGFNVEDGRPMAFFQSINSSGVYVWPVAMSILSFRAGRWHLKDIPRSPGAAWVFMGAFGGLVAVLLLIGFSMALSAPVPYRTGHALLQLMMITWYLFYRARPDAFRRVRGEIEMGHTQRMRLSSVEAVEIGRRLEVVVTDETVFSLQTLSLNKLAARLGIPVYKLSAYLNGTLEMSFPAWRNWVRIEYVKNKLRENLDLTILEIATEAGYSSKAVFNNQFRKLVGMSPSEYRNSQKIPT
jgi:AraC-like DNA-binding protein